MRDAERVRGVGLLGPCRRRVGVAARERPRRAAAVGTRKTANKKMVE